MVTDHGRSRDGADPATAPPGDMRVAHRSPTREALALAERSVALMWEQDHFSRWLGIEIVSIAPQACTLRATVREDMLNGFGICHGGVTFALADSALAFASNSHGQLTMSIENGISYIAPAHSGDVLTATATEEAGGGPLARYRVDVVNQTGAPVAIFRGTVYRTKRPLGAFAPERGERGKDKADNADL
jgi:acyl-CoA thioesterase